MLFLRCNPMVTGKGANMATTVSRWQERKRERERGRERERESVCTCVLVHEETRGQ